MHERRSQDQAAIRTDLGAIFVSLELSRSTWLITSLSPGAGERLSKHSVSAAISAACWRGSLSFSRGRQPVRTGCFRSSRSRRPA